MKIFHYFRATNDADARHKKPSAKAPLLLVTTTVIMGMIGLWLCLTSSPSSSAATAARLRTDGASAATSHPPEATTLHRKLTELKFFGREPDISAFPLPLCGGDCDGDSECEDGLVCYRRSAGDPIPGCESDGMLDSPTDYCVFPEAVASMPSPDISEELTNNNDFNGRATTDTDDTVEEPPTPSPSMALRGTNTEAPTFPGEKFDPNVPTSAPNTVIPTFEFRGPPVSSAPSSETWGVLANNTDPIPLDYVGNDNEFGDADYPLGPCQGDCDRDKDCYGELECFQRKGGDAVPGCIGIDDDGGDYCVFPEHLREKNETEKEIAPWQNGFQIKLYWEEGYLWQNETIERKWCITRDYEGSPVTGECWYGDFSLPCNASETYVSRCSDPDDPDPTQLFDFVPVSSDEVLIKAHDEDRCFHRVQRNVTLETCNATNHRQRWMAVRGGFNEPRFELSQKRVSKWCLNQDHHPKYGERVRMYECEKIRHKSHETSWFNLY